MALIEASIIAFSRALWRKSTRSSSNGACVEVAAPVPHLVAVRDSKDPGGPMLAFPHADWRRFVSRVKTAAYDL